MQTDASAFGACLRAVLRADAPRWFCPGNSTCSGAQSNCAGAWVSGMPGTGVSALGPLVTPDALVPFILSAIAVLATALVLAYGVACLHVYVVARYVSCGSCGGLVDASAKRAAASPARRPWPERWRRAPRPGAELAERP